MYRIMLCSVALLASCAPKKESNNSITLALAGDTMLGRSVSPIIEQKGYRYVWGDLLPLLQETDLKLINLETTLTRAPTPVPKVFNYKSNPANVQALVDAKIDVVSLANNHSKDFGNEGLIETINVLDQAGIYHVGAGENIQQARRPVIITKNNIRIGILGATDNEPTWKATADEPGINYISIAHIDELLQDIKNLKQQADIVIVSLHWGPNMKQYPSQLFQNAAHQMIDAGADIIHGHSAHIFQAIELYNNKLIFYDTGDFVDDYAIDSKLRNDRSFLFLVNVTKDGPQKLKLVPTLIENMQVNIAQGADRTESFERMQMLSAKLNTTLPRKEEWIEIKPMSN